MRIRLAPVEYKLCHRCSALGPAQGKPAGDWAALADGDYLVHVVYGIGKCRGLMDLDISGVQRQYLCIEYDGGGRVFVPSDRMNEVLRYDGEGQPNLARLGTRGGVVEYEGDHCPYCGSGFDPEQSLRTTNMRLILNQKDPPSYEPERRFRCLNKTAHYEKLVGAKPDDKLPDRWSNICNPSDQMTVEQQAAENLVKNTERLRELVQSQGGDERTAKLVLAEILKGTEKKRCQLCGGGVSSRPSTVWVRRFHGDAESTEELASRQLLVAPAALGGDDDGDG